MEPSGREFARDHHVHYEVEPEEVTAGEAPGVVGFQVRLFATHGESKLPAPSCRRCAALAAELRSFAERLVSAADVASRTELVEGSPALYQSQEVAGADEVALTLRVRCDATARGGSSEERCLAELRRQLDEAGVPRR
jgi:hypothetical protein